MMLKSRNNDEPDLNLTPLIDVVFLLLIFFMVSTTFDKDAELSIELPEASGKAIPDKAFRIEISIDGQGRYFVNGKRIKDNSIVTLKKAIQVTLADHKQASLIISADRKTPHESVIRAMDAARQLGLYKLTFSAIQSGD